MSELPSGWCDTKFTEVFDVQGGTQPPKSTFIDTPNNGYIRLLQIRDFGSKPVPTYIPEKKTLKTCEKDDLLIARYGASLGRICTGKEGAYNVALAKLICPDEISKAFAKYYLNSDQFQSPLRLLSRSAQNGFNKEDLSDFDLSLPPAAEQTRIAAKLDELLAQVDTLKVRIDGIPALLKRFRQSVLAAAVSGRLTEEWRTLNKPQKVNFEKVKAKLLSLGITKGNFPSAAQAFSTEKEAQHSLSHTTDWPTLRVGDLCECIVPNRDKPKSFSGNIHWLVTENIADQSIYISYKDIKSGLALDEVKEYKAKIIPKNSVIMTCVGRLGLSAITEEECVINQQLHAFLESQYLSPKFLAFAIRANKKYFEEKSTSTTVSYLNKTACNAMPIGLPSLEEQTEIIRHVEQLFAFADQLEAKANEAKTRIDRLTQSILAKAFRGELVPQDPNDEPASVLLARIQAQRASAPKARRTRKA